MVSTSGLEIPTLEDEDDPAVKSRRSSRSSRSTDSVMIVEKESSESYEYTPVDSELQVARKKSQKSAKKLAYEEDTEPLTVTMLDRDKELWGRPTLEDEGLEAKVIVEPQEERRGDDQEELMEQDDDDEKSDELEVKDAEEKVEEEEPMMLDNEMNNNGKATPSKVPQPSTSSGKSKVFTHIRPKSAKKKDLSSSSEVHSPKVTPKSKAKKSGKASTPKPWETPRSKRKKRMPKSVGKEMEEEDPNDPYAYRMSQSQRDRKGREEVVSGLQERTRERLQSVSSSLCCDCSLNAVERLRGREVGMRKVRKERGEA